MSGHCAACFELRDGTCKCYPEPAPKVQTHPYREPEPREEDTEAEDTCPTTPLYASPKWTGARAADAAERVLFFVGIVALVSVMVANIEAPKLAIVGAAALVIYVIARHHP